MGEQQFGLDIKLLRERLQLSAKDLAERVGLSPSQMSRLESGQRRVDAVLLSKIARALEVHPSYFFQGFEGDPAAPAPDATNAPLAGRAPAQEAADPGPPLYNPPPSTLGRVIRAERRRRHLTAEELGQKIGKGRSFVQDVENARTDLVTGDVLHKIARALKLDPELLLEAQRVEIRELRRSLRRLERAHTERTLGELDLESPVAPRRGVPIVEAEDGGLPRYFDKGVPEGKVQDYLFVPGLRSQSGFAVAWRGDVMEALAPPSFRAGELLVFAADREARHRDFVLAALPGESLFRQLFLDPKGLVRLQPLNLDYPPTILDRDEVGGLFPLVARLQRF